MGLGLETSDSNDLLELDPWSTSVPTNLPLDAYGVGGMGSSTLGLSTSPELGQGEPSMPYHCKLTYFSYIIKYLHFFNYKCMGQKWPFSYFTH